MNLDKIREIQKFGDVESTDNAAKIYQGIMEIHQASKGYFDAEGEYIELELNLLEEDIENYIECLKNKAVNDECNK